MEETEKNSWEKENLEFSLKNGSKQSSFNRLEMVIKQR